jgi:Kdo2-lipid IVA lauroyltransferase/acyltransferase
MEQPLSYFIKRPRYWLRLIVMAFAWLIAQLPTSVHLILANGLAWVLLRLGKSRKKIAQTNIALCFKHQSKKQQAALLEQNFKQTALGLIEITACWFTQLSSRRKHVEIIGKEHLDAAHAKGKGVILLSFHLTSLEIGGCLLGHHYPIMAMYKPNKDPLIERMMRVGRLRHIKGLIKQNDARGAIKALKKNQIVWYATDQNNGGKTAIFAPFFGINATTLTATTKFSQLTGATVIPFTQAATEDKKSYVLTLHPALDKFPGESAEADAIRINQWLEKYLMQYPENYLWLHQRFRTRPKGEAAIYKR